MSRVNPLSSLSLLAVLVLAGCSSQAPQPLKKGEKAIDVASVVRQKMPASVKDRDAWAKDLATTFESQGLAPTLENVCSVLAVAQQESNYQADPAVPGLSKIAWQEIDRRAERMHIPAFLVPDPEDADSECLSSSDPAAFLRGAVLFTGLFFSEASCSAAFFSADAFSAGVFFSAAFRRAASFSGAGAFTFTASETGLFLSDPATGAAAALAAIFFARCLSRFHCFLQSRQIAYSLKTGSPFSSVPTCLFFSSTSFPHIGHFICILLSFVRLSF